MLGLAQCLEAALQVFLHARFLGTHNFQTASAKSIRKFCSDGLVLQSMSMMSFGSTCSSRLPGQLSRIQTGGRMTNVGITCKQAQVDRYVLPHDASC